MSIATQTTKRRTKALKPMVPDFCPACDAVDVPFPVVMKPTEQEYRGEKLTVMAPAHECSNCGFRMLGAGHLDALCKVTSDAYRQKHSLLTSAEIIERRKAMHMAQRSFANHVGVSVASLKRWESGLLVQDKASDELVRLKTDHVYFTGEIPLAMKPQVETLLETCMNGVMKQAGSLLAGAAQAMTNFFATSENAYQAADSNELALAA